MPSENEEHKKVNEVQIQILKVKFKHLGEGGVATMKYNYRNGRYENIDKDINGWDDSNYIQFKAIEQANSDSFEAIIDKSDIPF